mmetsp:Transcript_49376/g.112114  ORF Transcript_49376/g.112114 Transcript_49376/m.112114 type:complete len:160 (+) Transcript_49376:70-549(+)
MSRFLNALAVEGTQNTREPMISAVPFASVLLADHETAEQVHPEVNDAVLDFALECPEEFPRFFPGLVSDRKLLASLPATHIFRKQFHRRVIAATKESFPRSASQLQHSVDVALENAARRRRDQLRKILSAVPQSPVQVSALYLLHQREETLFELVMTFW